MLIVKIYTKKQGIKMAVSTERVLDIRNRVYTGRIIQKLKPYIATVCFTFSHN